MQELGGLHGGDSICLGWDINRRLEERYFTHKEKNVRKHRARKCMRGVRGVVTSSA